MTDRKTCPEMKGKFCTGVKCAKFASCTGEEIAALYSMHLDDEAKQLAKDAEKIIRGEK